jgi:hypothetical protein
MIVMAVLFSNFTSVLKAEIYNAYITPEFPTVSDNITIFVEGIEGAGPVNIYDTDFAINGTSLTLDFYIETGFLTVITYWNHPENIGALPFAQYDLNVNEYLLSTLIDTYPISFTVTPESASILFISSGFLGIIRYSRKRL